MPDHIIRVTIATKTAEIGDILDGIVRSMDGVFVLPASDAHRPDLLIHELSEDIEGEFAQIQSLIDSDAVGEVFLTSRNADQSVLIRAMRTGIKEFFSQPIIDAEVREAVQKLKDRLKVSKEKEPAKTGQIINVMGSKGGVGTTSMAVNLAASLTREDEPPSVVLLDLNLLYGEVPLFLSFKPSHDWGTITNNIERLDPTYMMNILTTPAFGVYILPAPSQMNGYRLPTPDVLEQLLLFMKGMFDYVVIDSGQSFNELSLKAVELSDNILLVSVLSLPCLANTNKLFRSFSDIGYLPRGRFKIVINRYIKTSDISLKDAEESLAEPIYWTVPNDYRTSMAAINQGVPLYKISADAPITKSMSDLAQTLAFGEEEVRKKKKRKWWPFSGSRKTC